MGGPHGKNSYPRPIRLFDRFGVEVAYYSASYRASLVLYTALLRPQQCHKIQCVLIVSALLAPSAILYEGMDVWGQITRVKNPI